MTGCRQEEAFGLQKTDVHLDKAYMEIRYTLVEIEGEAGSIVVGPGERMRVTTQGLYFDEAIGGPLLDWTSRPWHVSQAAVLNANAHMLECLQTGKDAQTSGADNLKTYALVEAAYQSAASGMPVRPRA